MSFDLTTRIAGTLTGDPELRFTPSGQAVANFTIAVNERRKNPQTQQWEDGDASFLRCTAWKQLAENVAESLRKGDRVFAWGQLRQRNWETREGDKHSVLELTVDEIGPSLKWATARANKAGRSGGNGGQYAGQAAQGSYSQPPQQGGGYQPHDDPWTTPPAGAYAEPPF